MQLEVRNPQIGLEVRIPQMGMEVRILQMGPEVKISQMGLGHINPSSAGGEEEPAG